MENLKEQLTRLNENFSNATSKLSNVSQKWAFTILASGLTFLFKENLESLEWIPFAIIALAVISVLLDSIQYLYRAMSTRRLINDFIINNNISIDTESQMSKEIQEKSYKILLVKFCVLVFSTCFLCIFLIWNMFVILL